MNFVNIYDSYSWKSFLDYFVAKFLRGGWVGIFVRGEGF